LRAALAGAIRLTPAVADEAAALSAAYRAGAAPRHLGDRRSADAYASVRMPATFAAAAKAFAAGADRLPGFAPRSLLDVGAGTGATSWAATAVWPSLRALTLVEREAPVVDVGRALGAASGDPRLVGATWRRADAMDSALPAADLVSAGYLLGELAPGVIEGAVERLWAATRGVVVLVEPGSHAGYERIIAARSVLIRAGAHVAAPCPGDEPCPLAGSATAWCHFLARLDRSPLHRRAKAAERSWEDEPFAYLVAARVTTPVEPLPRVVLGRPRRRPGVVELRICADGRIEAVVVSRRDGERYRSARDMTWGDAVRLGFVTNG